MQALLEKILDVVIDNYDAELHEVCECNIQNAGKKLQNLILKNLHCAQRIG